MNKTCLAGLAALLLFSGALLAQAPEPEITIRQDGDKTIEEYRINGQLYAIKVTPKVGEPYYLVDSEGNGELDRQDRGRLVVPSWVLFKW